jgi:hypothetical protein
MIPTHRAVPAGGVGGGGGWAGARRNDVVYCSAEGGKVAFLTVAARERNFGSI